MTVTSVVELSDYPLSPGETATFYRATGTGTAGGELKPMTCVMSLKVNGSINSTMSYGWDG